MKKYIPYALAALLIMFILWFISAFFAVNKKADKGLERFSQSESGEDFSEQELVEELQRQIQEARENQEAEGEKERQEGSVLEADNTSFTVAPTTTTPRTTAPTPTQSAQAGHTHPHPHPHPHTTPSAPTAPAVSKTNPSSCVPTNVSGGVTVEDVTPSLELTSSRIQYTDELNVFIDVRDSQDSERLRFAAQNVNPVTVLALKYGVSSKDVLNAITISYDELTSLFAQDVRDITAVDAFVTNGHTVLSVLLNEKVYFFWHPTPNTYHAAEKTAKYLRVNKETFWNKF